MMSNHERLVYMANQIARNFEIDGAEKAMLETADHIAHYWDPRMKAQGFACLDKTENGLTPIAAGALARLRDAGAPAPQTPATHFNKGDQAGHADAG